MAKANNQTAKDIDVKVEESAEPSIISVQQESTEEHVSKVETLPDIDITLGVGMVLIAQVENGVETGVTFKVREREYQKYYSDTSKYILKKKVN